jgi:alpha-L-rhamnosidase
MNKTTLLLALTLFCSVVTAGQHKSNNLTGNTMKNSIIWKMKNGDTLNAPVSVGFRKQLEVKQIPQKAEMMIFADSRYILWINGKYIERGPCRFDPKGPQYDVLDIKRFIQTGQNTIAIMVQGNVTVNLKVMKHIPGLTARIKIDNQQYITDTSWKCSDQIPQQMIKDIWTWSCILDKVDANSPDFNWQLPLFDDNKWEAAVPVSGETWGPLTMRSIPLLRETDLGSGTILQIKNNSGTDTLKKKLPDNLPLKFIAGDEIVIDAGKLSLTYWTIGLTATNGTDLVFTPCQDFVKGETIINYNCITTYKAREGDQSYMSADTYGFRYLNIKVLNGSFTLNSLRFTSRLYPNIGIAKFECSDEFLNKTWQQTSYTAEVLCEDGYVDSAERAEWMGDVGMIQYPVSRMVISGPGEGKNKIKYSDPRLMHNMLLHTAQSQQPDGRLKAHHPSDRFDLHWYIEDYSCMWVQGLRQYYENTGDIKFVKELWPVLQRQMDWFLNHKNTSGLFTVREFLLHLDNPLRYQVCQGATVNAFIYKAFNDASFLAGKLGKNEEASGFQKEAVSLKSAYNKLMWDDVSESFYSAVYYPEFRKEDSLPDLKLVPIEDPASKSKEWSDGNVQWIEKGEKTPPTVQASLTALNKGIASDAHLNDVKKYLLTHSGELKNPYTHMMLFDEFYKYDIDSLDVKVLNIIRSRWKSMVSRVSPGTSAEGFETQGYLCHPFGLIPACVLPGYVLGIRKPDPVWMKTILIEPRLGDLLFASGVGLTEFGPVPVEWKKDGNNSLKFRFEIPKNIRAIVRLPKQGDQNEIILNGKPIHFKTDGRFLEFNAKPGIYEGEIKPAGKQAG